MTKFTISTTEGKKMSSSEDETPFLALSMQAEGDHKVLPTKHRRVGPWLATLFYLTLLAAAAAVVAVAVGLGVGLGRRARNSGLPSDPYKRADALLAEYPLIDG